MDCLDRVQREALLRAAVLAGDENAWRTWYEETFDDLHRYVRWRCGGRRDWADEIVPRPSAVPGVNRAAVSITAAKPPQMPRGPVVEKIRKALGSPSQMEFSEEALLNALDYLKDYHKIEVHYDSKAFESEGAPIEKEKISINTKGTPLAAALQLIEEQRPPIKFVVRDYGILVTTSKRAEEQAFFSAVEFAHLSAGDEAATPSTPSEPLDARGSSPARKVEPPPKPSTGPK